MTRMSVVHHRLHDYVNGSAVKIGDLWTERVYFVDSFLFLQWLLPFFQFCGVIDMS